MATNYVSSFSQMNGKNVLQCVKSMIYQEKKEETLYVEILYQRKSEHTSSPPPPFHLCFFQISLQFYFSNIYCQIDATISANVSNLFVFWLNCSI